MSDIAGLLLLCSPLLLAAALIGVGLIGSRLGAPRRRAIENLVLLPMATILVGGAAIRSALNGDWVRAASFALAFGAYILFIIKRRRGASPEKTTTGTGASA